MDQQLKYRLITGKDDSSFCERISKLIEEGYQLYGSPSVTYNGTDVIAAQAVILPNENTTDKSTAYFTRKL
ncbi:MAG: DUF1737 domain-containing protein [Sulfurospirillaceae bacterium]|nr:DUF1737 domain-containing protein [Sulfurospirillaceae bacterium]